MKKTKANIKTPDSQITLTLPVQHVSEMEAAAIDPSLLSFHRIPNETLKQIEPLKTLVTPFEVVKEDIVRARLALQAWFHSIQHSCNDDHNSNYHPYQSYKLRHIIPRSTRHCSTTVMKRKAFVIQQPVNRFHTDSTHTGFVNIWLPLMMMKHSNTTKKNHHHHNCLGFLHHPSCGLVTGLKLDEICNAKNNSSDSKDDTRDFLQACTVVYHPGLSYGDAIVFVSGGSRGVMHGSVTLTQKDDEEDENDDQNGGHRESVEFRCQKFDIDKEEWVYGDGMV